MARLVIRPAKVSTSALAVMREWSPAEFRANAARVMAEAADERRLFGDKATAREYLATAAMIREAGAILAPMRAK